MSGRILTIIKSEGSWGAVPSESGRIKTYLVDLMPEYFSCLIHGVGGVNHLASKLCM